MATVALACADRTIKTIFGKKPHAQVSQITWWVHEFDFNGVEVDGPHITFKTDRGKVYVSAVDEWVSEHVGDFVDVKAKWDTLLKDPKIKESYYRFIEEDAL